MGLFGGIAGGRGHTCVCGREGSRRSFSVTAQQDLGHRSRAGLRFRSRHVQLMVLAACVAVAALWTAARQGQVSTAIMSGLQLDRADGSHGSCPGFTAAMPQGLAHGSEIGRAADFSRWHDLDARYVAKLAGRVRMQDRKAIEEVENEISFIQGRIRWLEANPSYSDPDLGFSVYDTRTTGWLHVLSIAARAREALLKTRSEDAVPGTDALYRLGDGTPLYEAAQDKLPEVADVVDTLRGMGLPHAAFAGYRVYLLPFSLGDTSGLGTGGYMLVGAPAAGRKVIADQVPVTVAHEFGHHIQLMSLGASYWDNPRAWQRYMDVRGITEWTADGEVNSPAWAASPEETFAEDVRVLFGSDRAASEPHGTVYGDPRRNPSLAREVRDLIQAHARAIRQERRAAAVSPWVSQPRMGWFAWGNFLSRTQRSMSGAVLPIAASVLFGAVVALTARLGLQPRGTRFS